MALHSAKRLLPLIAGAALALGPISPGVAATDPADPPRPAKKPAAPAKAAQAKRPPAAKPAKAAPKKAGKPAPRTGKQARAKVPANRVASHATPARKATARPAGVATAHSDETIASTPVARQACQLNGKVYLLADCPANGAAPVADTLARAE